MNENINVDFLSKLLNDTDSGKLNENKERNKTDMIVCDKCGKYYKTTNHTCNEDEIQNLLNVYLNQKKCEVCGELHFDDRVHFCKGKQEGIVLENEIVDLDEKLKEIRK